MSEYPMEYEEFEKRVVELFLNMYPESKKEIILARVENLLEEDEELLKKLYDHTCIRYNRSKPYDNDEMSKVSHFEVLAANTLEMYIGGYFDRTNDMSDLKKIEKNFHFLIKKFFLKKDCIGNYDYHLPKLTEELYIQEEFHRVPGMFGGFFYFLKLENGKPLLYACASSRMDLEELFLIDEICYTLITNNDYYKLLCESNIKNHR